METDNIIPEKNVNSLSLLDEARTLVVRLEEANKKTRELIEYQEQLASRNKLGGRSEAGVMPIQPPIITDIQRAKALMEGRFI